MNAKLAANLAKLMLAVGLGLAIGLRMWSLLPIGPIFALLFYLHRRWRSHRFLKMIPYTVGALFTTELLVRLVLVFAFEWPFWTPAWQAKDYIYPYLVDQEYRPDDYNVLLLGGSVASDSFKEVPHRVRSTFEAYQDRPVQLYSAAYPSQTSRDSYLKYTMFPHHWDAVVIYHGINDGRMNLAPTAQYDNEYGFITWYSDLNFLSKYQYASAGSLTPFFLQKLWHTVVSHVTGMDILADGSPIRDLHANGEDIRSSVAFEANYRGIIEPCLADGTLVVIGSFGHAMPDDRGGTVWGESANVLAAIRAHNKVIRDLANEYPQIMWVDWRKALAESPGSFGDTCHLTNPGGDAWEAALDDALGLPAPTPESPPTAAPVTDTSPPGP